LSCVDVAFILMANHKKKGGCSIDYNLEIINNRIWMLVALQLFSVPIRCFCLPFVDDDESADAVRVVRFRRARISSSFR